VELQTFSLYTVLVSAVIVGIILAYLYVLQRDSHTGIWALGMLAYAGTFASDLLIHESLRVPGGEIGVVLTSVLAGILFVEGARILRGRTGSSLIWRIAAVISVIATLVLPVEPSWVRIAPSAIYLGAGLLYAGYLILRAEERAGKAHYMVGTSFLALGALAWIHPILESSPGPEGLRGDYLWTSVFGISLGIGVLFMHVREFAARLAEQGTEVARQAALLDQVSDGILRLDLALNVTFWSSACERMYGLAPEEVIGRSVVAVLPGEFVTVRPDVVFRRFAEEGRASWTMKYQVADGESVYFEISGSRVLDGADQPVGYVAVVRDVTERFRFQLEIDEGRERYRTLFESSPIPLWEEDLSSVKEYLDGLKASGVVDIAAYLRENRDALLECVTRVRVIDVNDATVRLYRADSKDTFRAGLEPYVHEDSIPAFAEEFAALAAGATNYTSEVRSKTIDGRDLVVRFTLAVPPGYEESLELVLVSDMDLTSYVGVQRELERYQDDLEELVERRTAQLRIVNDKMQEAIGAKDRLLANVSHEMRTPLNSIIGFTGVVAQGLAGEVTDEAKHQLTMANRSGKQLLALVNDLLDLNRLGNGTLELERAPVDIVNLLESTCSIVEPFAEEKGLVLTCDAHAMPEIVTDGDRVRQVLLNLISNAIKYTHSGSVDVQASADHQGVHLSVSDTGIGIKKADLEHVFDAFHQLAPTREAKHSGAGLGLAISREITQLLGGTLSAESKVGHGSVFTLTLPFDEV